MYMHVCSGNIHKSQKVEATQISISGSKDKLWQSIQQNILQPVLIHATTWMNLESIMLRERNQTKKKTHILHDFIYMK